MNTFSDASLEHLERLRERQYQLDIRRQHLVAQLFLADLFTQAWARYEDVEPAKEPTEKEEWRARGMARHALRRQSERASGSVARSRQ